MKALITVGCKTDHGGIIVLGDSSFLTDSRVNNQQNHFIFIFVRKLGLTHYYL